MRSQRPEPPQRANWGTCLYCGKRGWLTRRAAKRALKAIYPGQFQEMQVYLCPDGGNTFHHGHRVPERFRDSNLSSCRHCHRQIHRISAEDWAHEDGLMECGIRDVNDGMLVATPFWRTPR